MNNMIGEKTSQTIDCTHFVSLWSLSELKIIRNELSKEIKARMLKKAAEQSKEKRG